MAFNLPDFNISVDIYDRTSPPPAPPRLSVMGNLAFSKRVSSQSAEWPLDEFMVLMFLLLPQGTDVRDDSGFGASTANSDYVVAPAGSGRVYVVCSVDDIGKGFANEHRCAILSKAYKDLGGTGTFPGILWPIPMP